MIIDVQSLNNNMIIDEDVYNESGLLVLPKGFSSKNMQQITSLLENHNIAKVKVLVLEKDESLEKQVQDEVFFVDKKEQESAEFLEDFMELTNDFQSEIKKSSSGNAEKENLVLILRENITSSENKETNVFQLLQKLKDTDDLTFIHASSVALVAHKIGVWLKLNNTDLENLSIAALLSDVGKIEVDHDILHKEGKLSVSEFEVVKKHVDFSVEIVTKYGFNEEIINAVKFHHERSDGSGYPYGLKYDQIPLLSKIIAVADMFVALTSTRPHRDKMTPFEAVRILETEYMQKLDIVVLSEFIKRIATSYVGNPVRLSNGIEGEILFINNTVPLRPIISYNDKKNLIDLSSKENNNITIDEFY